jgi:predicted nucleic acid-binding protein
VTLPWAILDTSVYIGHWERGLFVAELAEVLRVHVVRHSSVVLSELRRGARTKEANAHVEGLRKALAVGWAPSAQDWWEAGDIVRTVGDAEDWEVTKRREFQNDALIALTARRHRATVVTTNRHDFELLAERTAISLRILDGGSARMRR